MKYIACVGLLSYRDICLPVIVHAINKISIIFLLWIIVYCLHDFTYVCILPSFNTGITSDASVTPTTMTLKIVLEWRNAREQRPTMQIAEVIPMVGILGDGVGFTQTFGSLGEGVKQTLGIEQG